MGELAPMRPSGLRRYSQFNAIVDKLAIHDKPGALEKLMGH